MAIQIVFPNVPNYTASYTIDGQEYIMNIRYNTRDTSWRVSINDANDQPILTGLKCMPNGGLTFRYSRDNNTLFTGDIICYDTERRSTQEINRGNFGTDKRFQLWYLTQREIQTLRTAAAARR